MIFFAASAQHTLVLSGKNKAEISNSDTQGFTFTLSVNNLELRKIKTPRGTFYQAVSQGMGSSTESGKPALPVLKKLMEIPADADVRISVISKTETTVDLRDYNINSPLLPFEPSAVKDGSAPDFRYDVKTYSDKRFYSLPLARSEYLGIMRNIRLARFSVSPFSYNPVTGKLKIVTSLKLRVEFLHGDMQKTISLKKKTFIPGDAVSAATLNGKAFAAAVPPLAYQYAQTFVIVTDTMFSKTLKPFVKMKERQGYKVKVAYTQDTAVGNTRNSIKAYLQSLYTGASVSDPAPAYSLIVGDVSKVPAFPSASGGYHITDLYYYEYTGDVFPELYYGRFSVDDTNELHNIIEKSLEYEQFLMPSVNFLDTSVLIAGYDAQKGATYGNGQVNYGSSNYYNAAHGISGKYYLYPNSGSQANQIRMDASSGVAFMNYSAHGNYDGWSNPSFKNSDVSVMTNVHKYPVMIGNACLTGKFEKNDCFGEVLTNAHQKGAVGYIGASDNTYWDEDFYWAVGYSSISATPTFTASGPGFFDGIFHDHGEPVQQWALSLGQIAQKGNLAVTQGGTRVRYYWEVYHVFGDPSLTYYTHSPSPMTPVYNSLLAIGLNNYSVTAEPYSLVAISVNDSLVASAFADSSGNATLVFNPFLQPATALLTITSQNKIPFTANLNVITPNGPYLILNQYDINDSAGNNNQRADNGESLKLNVKLTNLTSFNTGGVVAILSTADTSVVITDSTENISTFNGYDTLDLSNAFTLDVKNGVKDGHNVKFRITISDTSGTQWISQFYMQLYAPELHITGMSIDDNLGNGNGIAEAGETIIYRINIANTGSNDAFNGIAHLVPQSSLISGNTPFNADTLKTGQTAQLTFTKVINAAATTGQVCKLLFNLTTTGYSLNEVYYTMIGSVDEDFESGDFSKFHWTSQKGNSWTIDSTYKWEGKFSARSAVINDDDTSGLVITMNVLADDSISFYRLVSSEYTYDFLYFFIDGFMMQRWSGSKPWQRVSFPVGKGMHTFRWLYIKDYYDKDGLDAAWVDFIDFPVTDAWSSVEEAQSLFATAKLFPNPASTQVNISFTLLKPTTLDIEIYSATGKALRRISSGKTFGKGSNSMLVSIEELPSGLYFIRLKSADENYILKLIKM